MLRVHACRPDVSAHAIGARLFVLAPSWVPTAHGGPPSVSERRVGKETQEEGGGQL
jgi:hypothetical protein